MRRMSVGALPTCCTHEMKLINQKTMKKISLQTKLEDCSVPQRFIDAIKRGSGNIRIIYDLVSLTRCEFLRIGYVGKRCLSIWYEFLDEYGLHLGMTAKEILQYDPDGILQYDPESGFNPHSHMGSDCIVLIIFSYKELYYHFCESF